MDSTDDIEPTIDPEVKAFVFSLVSALGGSSAADDGQYVLGDDALAVLKDIKRWLRLYDDKTNRLDVARLLAEANLVKGDLLEILASWPDDAIEGTLRARIALYCVDLLTQLTWPVEKEGRDTSMHHFLHIPFLQNAQAGYKRAVLHHDTAQIMRTIVRVALPPMAQSREERSPVEENIIKVVMYFIRNIVMIKSPDTTPIDEQDPEIARSATIDVFHAQDVFNLLLTIGSGIGDEFQMHDVEILEILFHLVKGVDAERLFMENEHILSKDTVELQALIGKEKGMKAEQARYAPSRHNRFGAMVWVERDDKRRKTIFGQNATINEQSAMHEMDKSKKWKKPRRNARKAATEPDSDMDVNVPLTGKARRHLRLFVEQFLDSSFNPLFLSVRRSIEREAPRVLDHHKRQYFYLVAWFLKAETARRVKAGAQRASGIDQSQLESFGLVASVLNQETFVLLNRSMETAQDNKTWQDLNACMKCFTRILLTVQDMSDSPIEDDQEIAENILIRIFYEQSTHDRIITLLRTYNQQGFGYLDACTELAHVFLRLIERFSKQNVDMQVRSIRRARKKTIAKRITEEENHVSDDRGFEAEDVVEAQKTTSERRFDFNRLSAKFINQSTIETFVALTRYYRDLSDVQLKRAHRFFHRTAFKMDLSVYLFRADIILLFQSLVKGNGGMDITSSTFKEWQELVQQIFRRLVKKMEERPALAIEILFSKIPSTLFYLEHGYEREVPTRTERPLATQLEVKPGMDHTQQIGVAVSVLINQSKSDMLAWVKSVLSKAADERKSWEESNAARLSLEDASTGGPEPSMWSENTETRNGESIDLQQAVASSDQVQPANAPSILIITDNEERRIAIRRDRHLRLLLTLLSFNHIDYDSEDSGPLKTTWTIPSTTTSTQLTDDLALINRFEFDPPTYEDSKSAESFIRPKYKSTAISRAPVSMEDEEGTSDVSDVEARLYPAGGPTIRTPTAEKKALSRHRSKHAPDAHLDQSVLDERAAARRQLELERAKKIKSALYISVSDDESDEERDKVFYEKEAQLRRDMARGVKTAQPRKISKTSRKTKRTIETRGDSEEDSDEPPSKRGRRSTPETFITSPAASPMSSAGTMTLGDSEADTDPESTPASSTRPSSGHGDMGVSRATPLGLGISLYGDNADAVQDENEDAAIEDEADKENVPVSRSEKEASKRRKFVISDDEDE